MKAAVRERRRILAMRQTQLRIATGESSAARGVEENLELKRRQLNSLATTMHDAGRSCEMGRALHAQMELAQRLRDASDSMTGAIESARQRTAEAERQRLAAFQERERADRLADKAARALEEELDRRRNLQPRPIRRFFEDVEI